MLKMVMSVPDDKIDWAFIRKFWMVIRAKIKDGAVERGELEWTDIAAFMRVLVTLGLADRYMVPDDISEKFAGKDNSGELFTFTLPAHVMDVLAKKYEDPVVPLGDGFYSMAKELWLEALEEGKNKEAVPEEDSISEPIEPSDE